MILGDIQLEVDLSNLGMCNSQLEESAIAIILDYT